MKTMKQEHNHSSEQLALGEPTHATAAVARRTDPATSHEAAAGLTPAKLRSSHRRVLQLFRRFGEMTDEEALQAAKDDGWVISPSGLRSRRAEVTPPRGRGIVDTGKRRKTAGGGNATVWAIDEKAEPVRWEKAVARG